MSLDRLSGLLQHFRVHAELFHTGTLCGLTHFEAETGFGFLHVLRRGELKITHPGPGHCPASVEITQPTLIFYPRPITHQFHNPPQEGTDFTCARLSFEGGPDNPLARAIPDFVAIPLESVPELGQSLDLLFAETDQIRCGQRLIADRMFEVVILQLLRWLLDHPEACGTQAGLIAGLSEPRLARALCKMHESPGTDWSVERMAKEAGMSRTVFANTFKHIIGQTPQDYLTDWRMTLAKDALRRGRPIKSLAEDLGYATPSAFTRAFTARVGQPPRDWLKQ